MPGKRGVQILVVDGNKQSKLFNLVPTSEDKDIFFLLGIGRTVTEVNYPPQNFIKYFIKQGKNLELFLQFTGFCIMGICYFIRSKTSFVYACILVKLCNLNVLKDSKHIKINSD